MQNMKTWDGKAWRDYQAGDEKLPGALVGAAFDGLGSIDPRIPVITKADSVANVKKSHDRFTGTGGD